VLGNANPSVEFEPVEIALTKDDTGIVCLAALPAARQLRVACGSAPDIFEAQAAAGSTMFRWKGLIAKGRRLQGGPSSTCA